MYIIQLVNVEMNTSSMYKTWWIWTTKMAVSLVTSVFSPNFYEKLDIWDTTISCVQAAEVDARKFDSLCRWNGSWGPQTLGVARGVHVAPALRVALGVPPTKMHGGFVSRIYHAKRWEHPSISTGVVYPWRIRMYAIWMDPHLPSTKNPVMLASIYHTIGIRWIRRMDPSWANGVFLGTSSFTHAELIGKSSSEMWRLPDDIWCGDSWNLVGPFPKEFSMVLEYLPTFAPKISHVGKSW